MADKYISQGNTYDGDGTTKDAAASAGAVGAWNDILAIMTAAPTYGTLAGGDTVNVRTADGSGDLTASITAAKTMLARGDWDSFITWKFDDGTIWAESGTFIFSTTGDYKFTFSANNKWLGVDKNCKWYWDHTSSYTYWLDFDKRNIFIDTEFEFGTVNGKWPYCATQKFGIVYYIDCLFDIHSEQRYNLFRASNYNSDTVFMGCIFDFNSISAYSSTSDGLINPSVIGNKYFVYGGGFINLGAVKPALFNKQFTTNYTVACTETHGFDFQGLDRTDFGYNTSGYNKYINSANFFDLDSAFDFDSFTDAGYVSWHKGASFPTLNATLPDGTAWSLRCQNHDSDGCHMTRPYVDNVVQVNAEAGTKKLTIELLIANTITSPTDRDFFLEIAYYDEDNEVRWESTRSNISPSALTSSTASWSTTTYDSKSFTKYKIVYELEHDIEDDTLIDVVIGSGRTQASSDDWYFVCPDIVVEDA